VAPRIRYEDRVMRVNVAEYLRLQGRMCGQLGSSLYDVLLGHAADDAAAGGPVATVLDGYPHEPVYSALALRLMGSVHRLVLDGEAPALAAHYPSVGGDGDAERAWPAFRAVVASNEERLRSRIVNEGVQTNEVRRTAALVCGFLEVARATGHPLRCLEIGASGGLNLRWDRFRYEAATGVWGDAASPVVLSAPGAIGRPSIPRRKRAGRRFSRSCGPTSSNASRCSRPRATWRRGFRPRSSARTAPTGWASGWPHRAPAWRPSSTTRS
jgi:hypothetical protein